MASNIEINRWDMRLTDKEVLKVLATGERISYRALALRFECDPSTIARSIKRLKSAKKLIPVSGGRRVPMVWKVNL